MIVTVTISTHRTPSLAEPITTKEEGTVTNDSTISKPTQATPPPSTVDQSATTSEEATAKPEAGGTAAPVSNPTTQDSWQVNEQFSGSSLNSNLWEAATYPKGYRNNEEQDYTPGQVKVADGTLQITASRDNNGNWHSGEVHSKWAYTYGEFEVRAALSTTGAGVWPAAWLMGTTDQWPDNGEIDIFENINSEPTIYGTAHGGGTNGEWRFQKAFSPIDVTQYHTYKLVKKPGHISWWVDGVLYGEMDQLQTPAGSSWPFESHKNFGLLNLAIGGNWPGPSNADTPSAITMYVDYYTVKNAS